MTEIDFSITKDPNTLMDKLVYFQGQLSYLQNLANRFELQYEEQKLEIDRIESIARSSIIAELEKDGKRANDYIVNVIKSKLMNYEVEGTNVYKEKKKLIDLSSKLDNTERMVKTCVSGIDVCRSMLSYFREEKIKTSGGNF